MSTYHVGDHKGSGKAAAQRSLARGFAVRRHVVGNFRQKTRLQPQ